MRWASGKLIGRHASKPLQRADGIALSVETKGNGLASDQEPTPPDHTEQTDSPIDESALDNTDSELKTVSDSEANEVSTTTLEPQDDTSDKEELSTEENTDPFIQLGVKEWIADILKSLGYQSPTAIQAQSLPILLTGQDLIGEAQTGTGKTAAFSIPLIQLLPRKKERPPTPSAIVLAPTRELAMQVAQSVITYGGPAMERQLCLLYGGQPIGPQLGALRRQPAIIVGTPGRILDHIKRGTLDLSTIRFAVLDEADEMLKMGFIEDVSTILSHTPPSRQTALFSATMSRGVQRIADEYLKSDRAVVKVEGDRRSSDDVEQLILYTPREGKVAALAGLLELNAEGVRIVFARTRQDTSDLVDDLARYGHRAEALNGEMGQQLREAVVKRLRSGKLDTLIATDVAARGLDLDNVSLVVNFDLPFDSESYIHRVGRTGRAGQSGKAVSLVSPRDKRGLFRLERQLNQRLSIHPPLRPAQLMSARKKVLKQSLLSSVERVTTPSTSHRSPQLPKESSTEAELISEMINRDEEVTPVQPSPYHDVVYELLEEGQSLADIAAAALAIASHNRPLVRNKLPIRYEPEDIDPRKAKKLRRKEERSRGSSQVGDRVTIMFNVGHEQQARPGDLVGAITNEARIEGRALGSIAITYNQSFVEVDPHLVDRVIDRLKGRYICGVKVKPQISDMPVVDRDHKSRGGAQPPKRRRNRSNQNRDRSYREGRPPRRSKGKRRDR